MNQSLNENENRNESFTELSSSIRKRTRSFSTEERKELKPSNDSKPSDVQQVKKLVKKTKKRKYSKKGVGCSMEGCYRYARDGSLYCIRHGGGPRCTHEGCNHGARGKTGFCVLHGGGPRCKYDGCNHGAVGKDFCIRHGGGRRCLYEGCNKLVRGSSQYCKMHSRTSYQGKGKRKQVSTDKADNSDDGKVPTKEYDDSDAKQISQQFEELQNSPNTNIISSVGRRSKTPKSDNDQNSENKDINDEDDVALVRKVNNTSAHEDITTVHSARSTPLGFSSANYLFPGYTHYSSPPPMLPGHLGVPYIPPLPHPFPSTQWNLMHQVPIPRPTNELLHPSNFLHHHHHYGLNHGYLSRGHPVPFISNHPGITSQSIHDNSLQTNQIQNPNFLHEQNPRDHLDVTSTSIKR